MKCKRCIVIITAVFLIAVSGLVTADILPGEGPENQVFTTTSIVEGAGVSTGNTVLNWKIGDAPWQDANGAWNGLPNPWSTATGSIRSGSLAFANYGDLIMSNGGQISEVKSFSLDTHEKTAGLYNIETAKVLTYTTQNGSHLMGEESFVLDVVGEWNWGLDDIVCVFARGRDNFIPAFCNKVTASSKLRSVTTAQVETIGSMTVVGKTANVPAALNYEISVTPDANSASGYADGIFSTTFTASIMEGRSDVDLGKMNQIAAAAGIPGTPFNTIEELRTAIAADFQASGATPFDWTNWLWWLGLENLGSTMTYIDTATIAGGVSTFNQDFSYQSGIYCENCNF
jgi:hypothetical protein